QGDAPPSVVDKRGLAEAADASNRDQRALSLTGSLECRQQAITISFTAVQTIGHAQCCCGLGLANRKWSYRPGAAKVGGALREIVSQSLCASVAIIGILSHQAADDV